MQACRRLPFAVVSGRKVEKIVATVAVFGMGVWVAIYSKANIAPHSYGQVITDTSTQIVEAVDIVTSGTICAYGICQYDMACYNVKLAIWEVQHSGNDSQLLNNMARAGPPKHTDRHSNCDAKFQATLVNEASETRMTMPGTTYLVCCWVTHFGHVMVNMLVPAFHALGKFGLMSPLSNVSFLLDLRFTFKWGSNSTIVGLFEAIVGSGRVMTLPKVIDGTLATNNTHACFKKIIVGMLHDNILCSSANCDVNEKGRAASRGMFEPLRNELFRQHPEYYAMLRKPVVNPCRVLILDRDANLGRRIGDFGIMARLVRKTFREDWLTHASFFETLNLRSQFAEIGRTAVLITIGGTGSHWAIFLPSNSVSIEIRARNKAVNKNICLVAKHLKCFEVGSINDSAKNSPDIFANITELESALRNARQYVEETESCYAL